MEFFQLFSKFKKLRNLKVISRFLGHPGLFLDEKMNEINFLTKCHMSRSG